ncbi:MAG: hypothetical protein FE041_02845 [Thermoplasmata archaeon]|nr:MAG: hypothetical protein FE041_02845 [Thermoplasmata archaeon]
MFCVECGKKGKTYNGLCLDCYLKKKELIKIPDEISITFCRNCNAYKIEGEWKKGNHWKDLEEYIRSKVEAEIDVDVVVSKRKVVCTGIFEGRKIRKEKEIKIKEKERLCGRCSLIKGGYFEAILQVRGARENEEKEIDELVKRRVEERDSFISKRVKVKNGVDYYIGDKKVAAILAKEMKEEFGAEYGISSSLVGRKDGRDVYRDTYLIRFPAYKVDDFVKIDGKLYRIISTGKKMELESMDEEKKYLYKREMKKAIKVEVRKKNAIVLHESKEGLYVMDEETYKTFFVRKPKRWKGGKLKIFEWEGNVYAVEK